MKKTAILLAVMLVITLTTVGCGCAKKGGTEATQAPTATPIATVAPTVATQTPTVAPTQATALATVAPTEAATFQAEVATDTTLPATVPTATATTEGSTEGPTVSANASSSLGSPDPNGRYSITGTVVGYGPNTVIVKLGDGNEYEFNYNSTGKTSSDLYDGATVSIISDGDPSGAGVPNALSMVIG